jgi:hypothetical protein
MIGNQESHQHENTEDSDSEKYDEANELSDSEKEELFLEEAELERDREADAFFDSGLSVKEWEECKGKKIWDEIQRNRKSDKG